MGTEIIQEYSKKQNKTKQRKSVTFVFVIKKQLLRNQAKIGQTHESASSFAVQSTFKKVFNTVSNIYI